MAALRTALASLALLLAGGALLAHLTHGLRAFTTEAARRLEVRRHPTPIPDAVLEDQSGKLLRLADLRGRWLLVDFIYTDCRTLCLALGGDFARLQRELALPIARRQLVLLSISFDPGRDSPARLADYLRRMRSDGKGWLAARPTNAAALGRLERAFGITVIADGDAYVHNAAIHLVDPRGRLVRIFDFADPDAAARALSARLGS
ncbi:MAG TPA: SCO family protein [Burkholderiales bacterium]|nr:SCO family protein [Burkholderiales bacterium]